LIQGGLRPEIAHPEGNPPVLESMPQHMDQPEHITGVVEGHAELPHRVHLVGVLKPGPFLRLRPLNEVDQGMDIEAQQGIICVAALHISAERRQEGRLDPTIGRTKGKSPYFCLTGQKCGRDSFRLSTDHLP